MMNKEQAINLVNRFLRKSEEQMDAFGSGLPGCVNRTTKLQINTHLTQEHDFGWVFYFNTVKAIKTGDFRYGLAGNAPVIINKKTGQLLETGTAHQTSYYVEYYKKYGHLNGS